MIAPGIDIVIVNWNSGDHLDRALASIAASEKERVNIERVVVVDNDSSDDSLRATFRHDVPIEVLHNDTNRGFGAACNQGARIGKAKYVLFMNPDVVLARDTLDRALAAIEGSADVAALGVRLVGSDGETQRSCARFPTTVSMLLRSTGLDQLPPLRPFGYPMRDWDHASMRLVDHVMGAFYLVRRDVFEELQGFDERFFVYMEDVDLSRRISNAGHRILFAGDVVAEHVGGGTSAAVKDLRLCYSLHARLRYADIHLGKASKLVIGASTFSLELAARLARGALRGSASEVMETLRGYKLLLAYLKQR